ncbi:MlaD family protein [Antrihabitans sp. YC2-6]|uniref:MlaD family protein n=1 Tax=Antrihabitans sp. YC2-6 TaxID=2799498 RepID=UPI0018F62922|nr:MlaD family protein [Antrihabitans sp. YC2-6]MBJ8346719.1 MCE family protein [Antrihabitans sp. YC2-6]
MTGNKYVVAMLLVVALATGAVVTVTGKGYYDAHRGPIPICGYFRDAVGLYEGNKVTMLGVQIGNITEIEPVDDHVLVRMDVDRKATLPAELGAVTIASSIVTDRRVELTPGYTGGATFDSSACIPLERTRTPVGFTESMRAITQLSNDITGKDENAPLQAPPPDELSHAINVLAGQVESVAEPLNGSIKNVSGLLGDSASAANFILRQVLDNVGKISQGLDAGNSGAEFTLSAAADAANILTEIIPDIVRITHDVSVWVPTIARFIYRWGEPLVAGADYAYPHVHTFLSNVPAAVDVLRQIPPAAQNMMRMFDEDLGAGRLQYRPPSFRVNPQLAQDVCMIAVQVYPACNRDFTTGGAMDLGIVQLILAAAGQR